MDEKFSLLFQSKFSVGGGELVFQVCRKLFLCILVRFNMLLFLGLDIVTARGRNRTRQSGASRMGNGHMGQRVRRAWSHTVRSP